MDSLFSISFLRKQLYKTPIIDTTKKGVIVKNWIGSISNKKETEIKSAFMTMLFKDILGYTMFGDHKEYNLREEVKVPNSGQANFALGAFNSTNNIEVIGELKGLYTDLDKPQTSRRDLRTPVEQGLDYLHNLGDKANFLVISNMNEIRLYKRGIKHKFERFFFTFPKGFDSTGKMTLADDHELRRMIYLLGKKYLLTTNGKSNVGQLLSMQTEVEKSVEKGFYKEYKVFRSDLFNSLLEHNKTYENNKSKLLSLTQKFLDRIIFCWFCEDSREQLLPPDVLQNLIKDEAGSQYYNKYGNSIQGKVNGLFNAISVGESKHSPVFKIDKGYNGGLFEADSDLDDLIIPNYLFKTIAELSKYDFGNNKTPNNKTLTVDISGHIFEQSISDLEEMRASFEGKDYDVKKGKRRKEGVYYTPDYITRYIVEQAIGGWLKDEFTEIENTYKNWTPDFRKKEFKQFKGDQEWLENKRKRLIYSKYQTVLQSIKVLDPACGSGAFLVQAFNFLYGENRKVIEVIKDLTPSQPIYCDNDKEVKRILQNNLYGVDLNSESIEITKLSLWLRTAEKDKQLTDLDNNIKCGNSLIDDPKVAEDKAFNWNNEFSGIMKNGGFDVVIGNPPWGTDVMLSKNMDSSEHFIKKTFNLIKQEKAFFSFIVPISIVFANNWSQSRNILLNKKLLKLAKVGVAFEEVNLESCIFVLKNKQLEKTNTVNIAKFDPLKRFTPSKTEKLLGSIEQEIMNISSTLILADISEIVKSIILKVQKEKHFFKHYDREVFRGIYVPDSEKQHILDNGRGYLFINKVPDVSMYHIDTIRRIDLSHLYNKYKSKIEKVSRKRIIIKVLRGRKLTACLANKDILSTEKLVNVIVNDDTLSLLYLLSLINSKLISFYMGKVVFSDITETSRVMDDYYLKKMPVKRLSIENQQPFIKKADLMLNLNKELYKKTTDFLGWIKLTYSPKKINTKLKSLYKLTEQDFFKELKKQKLIPKREQYTKLKEGWQELRDLYDKISKTDREIDNMVFDLYGLTTEEKRIVLDG